MIESLLMASCNSSSEGPGTGKIVAYIVHDEFLFPIDITDPLNMEKMDSPISALADSPLTLNIVDSTPYLYIIDSSNHLHLYDVSNPYSPNDFYSTNEQYSANCLNATANLDILLSELYVIYLFTWSLGELERIDNLDDNRIVSIKYVKGLGDGTVIAVGSDANIGRVMALSVDFTIEEVLDDADFQNCKNAGNYLNTENYIEMFVIVVDGGLALVAYDGDSFIKANYVSNSDISGDTIALSIDPINYLIFITTADYILVYEVDGFNLDIRQGLPINISGARSSALDIDTHVLYVLGRDKFSSFDVSDVENITALDTIILPDSDIGRNVILN